MDASSSGFPIEVVRHRCDNGLCVNWWHLETGTQGDNVQDMYDRGQRVKHGPVEGSCFTCGTAASVPYSRWRKSRRIYCSTQCVRAQQGRRR